MLTFVVIFAVVVTTTNAAGCSMVNEQWDHQGLAPHVIKRIKNSSPKKCEQSCIGHMGIECKAIEFNLASGICVLFNSKKNFASPNSGSIFSEKDCGAVPPPCYMTAGQEGRHGLSQSNKILTLDHTDLKECKEACLAFAGREECAGVEWQQGNHCHLFNTSQSRSYPSAFKSIFSEKKC